MAHSVRFVELLKRIFSARFFVARATRLGPVGRFFDRWLFEGDDLLFLPGDGAVRRIQVDQAVELREDVVLPSQVVDHFIDRAEVHWIMNFCLCRASEGCEDYPIELGCLFLGETALQIDPELGRRVSREEAHEHVRRCREAGLVHFVGRNKLDTVWLGVGPGEKLFTICNCCPCCCLWRVLPLVAPRIGRKFKRMPGVTVSVDGACIGCGECTQGVCFVDAIRLVDGHAEISDACKGCGRCVEACPQGAVELSVDAEGAVRASIERLAPLVNL